MPPCARDSAVIVGGLGRSASIAKADEIGPPGTSLMPGPKRGAHQNGPASAAMAEARTCFVFPVHREEIWALDRGMAADHRGLWPRKAYGHRELPEVRAWYGSRPRQRTRRLDARR